MTFISGELIDRKLIELKLLRTKSSTNDNVAGQTMNLISNDVGNSDAFFTFLLSPLTGSSKIIASIYILVHYVGFSILTGLVFVVLILTMTIVFGKLNQKFK